MDFIIKNAKIVDGTGSKPYTGDVAVSDGMIQSVGQVDSLPAHHVIDADGRCLTPGFVDIHRHADLKMFSPDFGMAELSQGITTSISGNCGMSGAPCAVGKADMLYGYLEPCLGKPTSSGVFTTFQSYVEKAEQLTLPLNCGNYVGSGSVRIAVKGFDPSPMTKREMDMAKELISQAMDAGSFGLSMGIMYVPECCYSTDEMIELARVAGRKGGILVTHIRGEGDSMPTSVAEVIEIARCAEIPLQISHLKAAGRNNWGIALARAFEMIEAARAAGQDVSCDVYPYEAGSTMLFTLLPPSILRKGVEYALSIIKTPEGRADMRSALASQQDGWDNLLLSLGFECVVISSVETVENQKYVGKNVAEIACTMGCDAIDAICNLLIAEGGKVGIVIFSMSEKDVREVITKPYSLLISDSIYPASGNPHPRLYGAFPRVIAKYVCEEKLLTLEQAVRKMTSMPAQRLNIQKRGQIQPGYHADLLLFYPEKIRDTATYENPKQYAQGIDLAIINGEIALEAGKLTAVRKGRFLRHSK